jgi:hypothetical protein
MVNSRGIVNDCTIVKFSGKHQMPNEFELATTKAATLSASAAIKPLVDHGSGALV